MKVNERPAFPKKPTPSSAPLLPAPTPRTPRGFSDVSDFERPSASAAAPSAQPTQPPKTASTGEALGEAALLGVGAAVVATTTSAALGAGATISLGTLLRNAVSFVGREGFRDLAMQLTALFSALFAGGAMGLIAVAQGIRAGAKSSGKTSLETRTASALAYPARAFKRASDRLACTFRTGKAAWRRADGFFAGLGQAIKTGAKLGTLTGASVGTFAGLVQGAATTAVLLSAGGTLPAIALSLVGGVVGTFLGRAVGAVVGSVTGGLLGAVTGLLAAPSR